MSLASAGNCLRRRGLSCYTGNAYRGYASTSQTRFSQPPPSVNSSPSEEAQERMNKSSPSASNTHFGFRDVLEDEKIGLGKCWM
jgi:hypothetical protein